MKIQHHYVGLEYKKVNHPLHSFHYKLNRYLEKNSAYLPRYFSPLGFHGDGQIPSQVVLAKLQLFRKLLPVSVAFRRRNHARTFLQSLYREGGHESAPFAFTAVR